MKSKAFILALAVIIFLSSLTACMPDRTLDAMKPNITITFTYAESLRHSPSYAVWIEDESGYHVTVYATRMAAENWKKEQWASVLPIWYGVREKDVDAVTGATSKGGAIIQFNIPDEFAGKKITLFLEANASYDYNDYYKEGLKKEQVGFSGVNGQPSMLWSLQLDPGEQKIGEATMKPAGAGDVLGNNHKVHDNLINVTAAKKLLLDIKVRYDFVK